jgi:RecA-family ATPase
VALANVCNGRALCIIDSLRGIAPDMDENSSAFGAVLQALASISDATEQDSGIGCTFIVLHHEGKPQQGSSRQAKHSGRGSSAIQDRAGAVWRIVPSESVEKEVEWSMTKISEHDTEFCKPFSTRFIAVDGGGVLLRASGVEKRQDAVKQSVVEMATRLTAKLRKADRWMPRTELLTDVSGRNGDKADALSYLREQTRVAYKLEGSCHMYHWNPKMDPRA